MKERQLNREKITQRENKTYRKGNKEKMKQTKLINEIIKRRESETEKIKYREKETETVRQTLSNRNRQ